MKYTVVKVRSEFEIFFKVQITERIVLYETIRTEEQKRTEELLVNTFPKSVFSLL